VLLWSKEIIGIKKKISPVLKKYGIKKAGIFGSYARGDQKKKSDVDILVEIKDSKMSLLGVIKIENELEDVPGLKVDLVEYKSLNHLIKNRILKEEVRVIWRMIWFTLNIF